MREEGRNVEFGLLEGKAELSVICEAVEMDIKFVENIAIGKNVDND